MKRFNMNLLNTLLVIYLLLLVCSLLFENGNICAPSVITMASFSVMILLAILANDYLGINLKEKTVVVMISAAVVFIITEIIVETIKRNNRNVVDVEFSKEQPIIVNNVMQTLILLFVVFCLLLSLYVIFSTSGGSFATRMHVYKMVVINGGSLKYLFIVNQLYKIAQGLMYVLGYILIYNYTIHGIKVAKYLKSFVAIIVFSIYAAISQGARQPLIEYFVFMGVVFLLLKEKDHDKKAVMKFIIRVIPILIITAIAFYYSMSLVGRTFHEGKTIIHYIAEYFSGGLYKFNNDIDYPATSVYFGRQSLKEFYSSFVKLGLLSNKYSNFQPVFDKYGNTVTMYGRWYEDWGVAGVIIMCILTSWFFTNLYVKTKKIKGTTSSKHLHIILYAFLVIALVWAGYDDRIKAVITLTTVYKLLCLYFFYWFLIKKKVRIRFGRGTK